MKTKGKERVFYPSRVSQVTISHLIFNTWPQPSALLHYNFY